MMDTSSTYIKMCDCPEIQGKWRYKHDNVVSTADGIFSDLRNRSLKGKYTWLPRQDQIQEMMGIKTALGFRDAIDDMLYERDEGGLYDTMAEWVDVHDRQKTPEQLWLAFYMHEKHQEIWSSKEEKWVKK